MTVLAITGHRDLPERTEHLVDSALRAELSRRTDLVAISCLADGADALFARAALDLGGSLLVVVPATKYRAELPRSHHATYDALLAEAAEIIRLDHVESDSAAHMDASISMIERADELVAVWDGQPARGYGGTADVVHAAHDRQIPVVVVWPEGAERR